MASSHNSMGVSLPRFNLNFSLCDGANASTNIAVTGIKTTDKLIAVIESADTSAVLTDRTSTTSITSNGYIQCTDATTSDKLMVFWVDCSK